MKYIGCGETYIGSHNFSIKRVCFLFASFIFLWDKDEKEKKKKQPTKSSLQEALWLQNIHVLVFIQNMSFKSLFTIIKPILCDWIYWNKISHIDLCVSGLLTGMPKNCLNTDFIIIFHGAAFLGRIEFVSYCAVLYSSWWITNCLCLW